MKTVGKPIDVTKVTEPSEQQLTELHEKYIQSLKDLFEENKSKFGYKDLELNIK